MVFCLHLILGYTSIKMNEYIFANSTTNMGIITLYYSHN